MKTGLKRIPTLLLVLVLSLTFCFLMNRFNSKYTAPGVQPMDGLLILSEEELDAHSIHYLINGWAFYPDVLLGPEDLQNGNEYMVYTDIGEHTRFDLLDPERLHGCGTYALNLYLPETSNSYALQLPEIYSAYRLYINGKLAAQAGSPDTADYQPLTQSRIVSFEAGGAVQLVLNVGNWSHFYSGLVYPPALGRADDVARLQSAQAAISGCVILSAMLGAILSLWLGIRMKQENARLFALLCLISALNACAPMLHFFLELPLQPWYALEIFLGYCTTAMILCLQNQICQVQKWYAQIAETAAFVFCALALIYGLCASRVNALHTEIFSVLAMLFKFGSAGWMLAISLKAILERNMAVEQLFYGAVFHAAMLMGDRILPEYEPIIGGWFPQWGTLVFTVLIAHMLWQEITNSYTYSVAFAEEHRQLKRQLDMQLEHARVIANSQQENQRRVHDFRQHIRSICCLAEKIRSQGDTQDSYESLLAYLAELGQTETVQGEIREIRSNALCNIPAVDALLQYYNRLAENKGIEARLHLFIPEKLPLNELEWSSVLGNLLENALEGCTHANVEYPQIHIITKWTGKTFFLMIENTYKGIYKRRGDLFLSEKRNYQCAGIGLESVREKIVHHGGTLDVYPMENIFRVGISLTGPDS